MKSLLVTMGDAAGIGPEIVVRAFVQGQLSDAVVVGDPEVLARASRLVQTLGVPVAEISAPTERGVAPPGALPVWRPPGLPPGLADLPWGQIDARGGAAAATCIEAAVRALQAGQGAAIVTAPIHKEALAAAPGAPLPPVRMMLANDELRVVLVTIHVALRRAIEALSIDAVLQTLRITHAAVRGWQGGAPRIAVAGLNPHAGEGGLFGDEELTLIAPAIAAARAEGIDAQGPFPPDTVFMRARRRAGHAEPFDVVVAMTHDHGLIPVKYLGVEQGVNVTLGLPFVRTSPDHGTAFDIAGRGVADASSLVAAARVAREMVARGL